MFNSLLGYLWADSSITLSSEDKTVYQCESYHERYKVDIPVVILTAENLGDRRIAVYIVNVREDD